MPDDYDKPPTYKHRGEVPPSSLGASAATTTRSYKRDVRDLAMIQLDAAKGAISRLPWTRETSLVNTKIDEAMLWLKEDYDND